MCRGKKCGIILKPNVLVSPLIYTACNFIIINTDISRKLQYIYTKIREKIANFTLKSILNTPLSYRN